jgi:hypothetical protein
MRSFATRSLVSPALVRCISGAAPVLYFPPTTPSAPKEEQIAKNTEKAIGMIKRFKGEIPAPYTRKSEATIEQMERDIDDLLSAAAKMRKDMGDSSPMDKLSLIERVLKHALWSYKKDAGVYDWAEMQKWLVYTGKDQQRLAALKREVEIKQKYDEFLKQRHADGGLECTMPESDLNAEYKAMFDREALVEKRLRYDTLAVNCSHRDETVINNLLKEYVMPIQQQRLDNLSEMLEQLKPVLAREAINQRLAAKHLEGQLSIHRYLDWNPEVRDRTELHEDILYTDYYFSNTERDRMLAIRLPSVSEVKKNMEELQALEASGSQTTALTKGKDNSAREKLLREIVALQSRSSEKKE